MAERRLRGRLLQFVEPAGGPVADMVLIEPNGDEHRVRCLVKGEFTELGGERTMLDYLDRRYGGPAVCFAARRLVLGG